MNIQIEKFSKEIKEKSDVLINYFLVSYFIIGVLLAIFSDTWLIAFGVGGLSLVAYYVSKITLPHSDLYQYVLGAVIGIFMAQFIYQMHGLFEMHFFAFIGSAMLITYRNWKLQIPLAIVVFIHHAAFGYLQFVGFDKIYFTQLEYMSLQTFIIHCSLAASIFILCAKWAYDFNRTERDLMQKSFEIGKLEEANSQKDVLVAMGDNLKASNQKLREVNNELARIFNNVEEVLFSLDITTGRITQKSANCEKIYGYTPEQFYADADLWKRIIHDDDQKNLEQKFSELHQGSIVISQYRIIHKNKSIRWIEAKVVPTLDIKGQLIRIDGVCNDITERVSLQKKLAEEIKQKHQDITLAVITAQENERSLFGEELHDNINQILATAKLYIGSALIDTENRMELMKEGRGFINVAMEEIRKLSKTMTPPSLGKISLTGAIEDLINSIEKVNDCKFCTKWENVDEHFLDEKLQHAVFRIVQEQLNNIIKHAKADNVYITLKQQDSTAQLIIRDDGVGFDVSEKSAGVGLQNISSRVELMHGVVKITSAPGEGCEMLINFELEKEYQIKNENSIRA